MRRNVRAMMMLVCVSMILLSIVGFSRSVFAKKRTVNLGFYPVMEKAVLQGVANCYERGMIKGSIDSLSEYEGSGNLKKYILNPDFRYAETISLVTGFEGNGFDVTNKAFYCENFLGQVGEYSGGTTTYRSLLLSAFDKRTPSYSEVKGVIEMTKGLGYTVKNNEGIPDAKSCQRLSYSGDDYSRKTNTICLLEGGELVTVNVPGGESLPASGATYSLYQFKINGDGEICLMTNGVIPNTTITELGCTTVDAGNDSWLLEAVKDIVELNNAEYKGIKFDISSDDEINVADAYMGLESYYAVLPATMEGNIIYDRVIETMVSYLSNDMYKNKEDLALNDFEKRMLYQAYLKDYYEAGITCDVNEGELKEDAANGVYVIDWVDDDKVMKKCKVETEYSNKDDYVNGVNSDGYFSFDEKLNLRRLITEIQAIPKYYSDEDVEAYDEATEKNEAMSEQEDKCFKAKGIVAYLVCPAISAISGIGDYVYGQVEKDFLQIQVDKLFEEDGGLETAWGIFRDFANIAFVLLFLVVIFSQLTGVGIDNYGIKKILPKLIVAAVLINISFFVCELLADLSNVLGSSLKGLFSNLAGEIDVDGTKVGVGQSVALTGVVGGGALIWGLFATGGGGVVLAAATVGIAVLGVLITLVVSILVLYLILMIRNAGIVLLIAIAPVAIVCYMLPNTEKLFKKWVGLFKALLLVYPICGLLLGGGIFAGHVLASIGTTPMIIAGMVVEVLPFFFIPTILKNSLSMMGNIGSKLSSFGKSMGKRMSGSAQSAIKNSDKFKEWSGYQREQVAAKRAQRAVRRNNEDIANRIGQEENKDAKERFETIMDGLEKGGNVSDEDKKWYNDMKEKYQRKGWSGRRTRLANEKITKYESERDNDRVGTNAIAVVGERAKNRYSTENKAIDDSMWATASYIMDKGGDVWVQNEDGDYESVIDGKVSKKSGSDLIKEGGSLVSKSTAMARKDQIERARQTGELAAYATKAETIDKAARGARLSALENSQSGVVQNVISGNDKVLQAQYDANASKENKILGDADANAAFRKQGLSTITSVEAAQQAAEAQLTNIASQNLAAENFDARVQAGKYDVKKIRDDAVLAGAIKNINQTTNTVASNEAGEVVIDLDVAKQTAENEYKFAEAKNDIDKVSKISKEYADTVEQKRFDLAEEKMHGELLQNNSRGASLGVLEEAIVGKDKNKTMAAIKDVIAKGGIEDVNKLLQKTKFSDSGVKRAVHEYMATLSMEPMMKAYGKYAAEEGNDLEYGQWLVAKDDPIGDPGGKKSLAGFIRVNGESVLQNASKDTFKFYDGDEQRALRNSLSPIQVIRGVLTARDNETRVAGNKLMAKILAEQPDKLASALDRLSASDWAHMDASTFEVMSAALDNALNSGLPGISVPVESKIKETKEKIARAGGTIGANMRPEVKRFFDKY